MNTDKKLTAVGEIVTGYKATDKDMCCRGFRFEIGKWYEYEGDLKLCERGFHFCEYPSGPWSYYPYGRIFKIEAMGVILSYGPGADLKHVAKKIRLVEEINSGYDTGDRNTGDRNTGDRNTGDGNTGYGNTGYWNTGDGNTGDRNTGDGNTGYGNTGDRNTGDRNTGDRNTGDWNTGDGNIGDRNTGDGNTGYGNTGYWNTGDGNTGNSHSGCLNYGEAKFFIFNKPANRNEVDFNLVFSLSNLLMDDEEIDPSPFLSLPNATPEKILALHNAHIKERNAYRQRNA